MLKKHYGFGEYYSSRDILKITKKKLKKTKWSALLLPINLVLFVFSIIMSVLFYHIFIFNRFFNKVKFCCSDQAKLKARAIVFLTKILYEFYYVLYCITIPILNLFVNIYKICPSKIAYYSNQSPLFYDEELAEIKSKYRIEFDNIVNRVAQLTQIIHPKWEIDELFEEEFYYIAKYLNLEDEYDD